ncbi:MAG: MarR family transcriptional regulator [Actinobacteria bacterium]|nr:MarR family transcriptional regulator [Actinomycetota bacterium]
MTDSRPLANVFGALALAVADDLRDVTELAAGHGAAGPSALVALHEFLDHPTVEELRRVVGLTHAGAVRLVDRLEQQGYVVRRAGHDARSISVVLTATGRAAARRVLAARAAALDTVLAELTAEERTSLAALSATLLGSITRRRMADRARDDPPRNGWLCRLCDLEACGRARGECPAAAAAAAF